MRVNVDFANKIENERAAEAWKFDNEANELGTLCDFLSLLVPRA